MKVCNKCFKEKPNSDFYTHRRTCIKCVILLDKKNAWIRQIRIKQRRFEVKEQLVSSAGGTCSVCSGYFPPEVFDFHHLDPTKKETSVSVIGWNKEKAQQEADKCIMVCANCHRMIHAGRL